MRKYLFLLVLVITSCSSTKMVREYKKDTSFIAHKVLVIGISPNSKIREAFEKKVVNALEKKNVRAVKSIDFFESSFSNNKQPLEQINAIEYKLLEAGFDAVLFTKITGKQEKISVLDAYQNFVNTYQNFEDYYLDNQYLFYMEEQQKLAHIYTTETSLFCICLGKERELIWTGEIEVVETKRPNRSINRYLNILLKGFKKNKLLVYNKV